MAKKDFVETYEKGLCLEQDHQPNNQPIHLLYLISLSKCLYIACASIQCNIGIKLVKQYKNFLTKELFTIMSQMPVINKYHSSRATKLHNELCFVKIGFSV